MDRLKVGDRIYYTGDMANADGYARVVKVNPPSRWAPESVDIEFEEPRPEGGAQVWRGIFPAMFEPGPGRRFWRAEDFERDRAERIRRMQEACRVR